MARINNIVFCSLLLTSLVLSTSSSPAGTLYSVKDLGPLANLRADQPLSAPYGINEAGAVAAGNVTNGAYRAMLYAGAWQNLGTLGGAESMGFGINSSNQVVGRSQRADGVFRGFVWTPGSKDGVAGNEQMKMLGTLGGAASEANSINDSGQITGFADTASNPHAFRISGGVMTDIGSLLGKSLPNSFGYAINSAGQVVGAAYDQGYSQPHAFFYNGATAVTIGDLGGTGSAAMSINDQGQIVGYWITSGALERAFRYSGGVMKDLGTLGGHYGYAIDINDDGKIVGGSFTDAKDTVYHAFISEGDTLVDLNTLLDASGTGWVLQEARAINDAGQIVGTALYSGSPRAFLLQPAAAPAAPRITGVAVNGQNVLVSFTTVSQGSYELVSRAQARTGAWTPVVTGIRGTGGTVTVTHTGGVNSTQLFYRVVLTGQ